MTKSIVLHINFWEYSFYSPLWLILLAIIPILIYFKYKGLNNAKGEVKFSRPKRELKSLAFSPIDYLITGIYALLSLGIFFLILALAKPYLPSAETEDYIYEEGIDIIISMDVSGSMLATDFLPNRLEAAKQMAIEFVDNRKTDRIGYVVFEGEAYTACPTTRNYDYLKKVIEETQTGLIEPGTAIGTGLGTAVARLRSDSLSTKVIILLTDGENNRGEVSPMAAAELAKSQGITVYTVGVGKRGYVDTPVNTPFGVIIQKTEVTIDEDLLTRIAESTGGKYFRAIDESSLREIYHTIDELETNKLADKPLSTEPPFKPGAFILFGLACLVPGLLLEQLIIRKNT